jgi:DNA polymerase-1
MATTATELPAPGEADVLYLVDLSGYVFRAYHAIAPLTSPTGEPTHATYGTVNMLSKLVEERRPAYLAVAMDAPGRTFRDDLDARYKAHRPAPPADLMVQMERCREIVEAYGIPIFAGDGLEADDFIAALVAKARERALRVVIASADKDLMQLVDDGDVVLWDAMRDKVFGTPEVVEKFGVPPTQMRDLLALVGDTSDNVPGVKGVGPKTAAELLAQHGSLDGIYAHLDEVKKPRLRETLREHEGEARLSQRLVTLRDDAAVTLDLEALRYGGADGARLRDIFTALGFTRFVKSAPPPKAVHGSYRALLTRDELSAFVERARAGQKLAIELHATSRDAMRASICGLALAVTPGEAVYVPLGHRYLGAPAQVTEADALAILGPILADPAIAKVGHDLKFAEVLLLRRGLPLAGAAFDTMLAAYLLEPEEPNDLGRIAQRDASVSLVDFETLAPKKRGQPQRTLDDLDVDVATPYAAPFADVCLELERRYAKRLADAGLDKVLAELELPLSSLLARMEHDGVLVDPAALDELGKRMAIELAQIEGRARALVGQDLNLASPRQLEAVLFDELKLRVTKRTRTGRSTDADALEAIADDHPLPGLVLEHRAIAKLKGTYVDALPKLIHPDTGRIHTRWQQAVAATGRISSQDPNLQNVPIRTDLGKLIRRAFVAPPGSVIVSADYSQIELRILAHLSKDPVLVDAFNRAEDVHVRTAMEIFGVTKDAVTDEMRRRSKTINFGVIYGMGAVALAKRLGIPRPEAAAFIDAYFARYAGVREFMERTMAEARKTEVVRTMAGRLRHLADLRSSDGMRRAQAERIAQNTPIQGTAADLLKMAMVALRDPVVPGARMVLTVHDELAFEVPEGEAHEAAEKIRRAMTSVARLDVPLVVEVGQGSTWADAH